ncbi:strictosidine synthase family protein [Hyphobacterium marinum]|uniref:SMP-30/gluconolactonase/LRE family protein n=1 Tax=Hyphobacterium marinum TaxID=3116574 RepID=A0ABU7LW78_9PROT|nr:SMP-30/gluconolactonase/LRE family protein [Hyphobacterium sp. Y6023]MEE2565807.1 SMP-30/gluconolactonase/LRE family protein [Hyphobacterium sp. Y6023]
MRAMLIGLLVLVLLVLGRFGAVVIPASGMMADLEPRLTDQCERLDIAPGTEDVTIDPVSGLAFVSTDDRRTGERGAIYSFDPEDPAILREVSGAMPDEFHPHGISLWTGRTGAQRLFVVNHTGDGRHAIEIFDVGDEGRLTHAETVRHSALISPNDVLAVGPRQFYATNDRRYTDGLMGSLEAYFALPLASVSYYDGETGRIAAERLAYANGINMSADGRTVYVAEILGRGVRVYRRDPATGDLERLRDISVPTAPDNIEIAEDGALWIGGHPRVFDFVAHADDVAQTAPSHVIRVDPDTGEVETVLMDTEGRINASSVAAVTGNTLIVGAVFDGHVLICPLDGSDS